MRDEILDGLERGEFHVLYQPQMTADGACMAVVEALVRWNSRNRGAVGPADFAAFVEARLRETGLAPARLEREIVESALVENFDLAEQVLTRLRRRGVKIVRDDFGAGYSSLTYLRKFPLDKLKIDRSFVQESDTLVCAAIIQGLVAIARAIGLTITAEGV